MAAKSATMLSDFDVSGKNERLLMNKLRDKGLEYISTSGKIIAAKTQPALFCHCPQKCKNKLAQEKWDKLFKQFYDLGDQNKQNQFLQSHIVIKAVHLHNWESEKSTATNKRRVTCRYHVPDLKDNSKLDDYIKKKGSRSIDVCQKAFMNCFGITEKRVRMQRERCISRLAPGHYKNSPFGKKQRSGKTKMNTEKNSKQSDELANELQLSPLDLSSEQKSEWKRKSYSEVFESTENSLLEDIEKSQPLDLSLEQSLSNALNVPPFELQKRKLYDIAGEIGLSRHRIDKEMAEKYEQILKHKLKKQHKNFAKLYRQCSFEDSLTNYNNTEIENRSPSMNAIVEQVVGLGDDFTILPIQTLNNGDLTITPVLGPISKPVENRDIMRVNSFFQNQLWKPEYLGLSSWCKLRSPSYDI